MGPTSGHKHGESPAERLLRVTDSFQEAKTILTAVALGVFDRLATSAADAATLADDLGLTVRGVEVLGNMLVGYAYLDKDADGRYANRPEWQPLLTSGAPQSLAHLTFRNELFRHFAHLDESVRRGRQMEPRDWALFYETVMNRHFALCMAQASRDRVRPWPNGLRPLPLIHLPRMETSGASWTWAAEPVTTPVDWPDGFRKWRSSPSTFLCRPKSPASSSPRKVWRGVSRRSPKSEEMFERTALVVGRRVA